MDWGSGVQFLGGVGLFLLGMRLMSDGLKVAAGPALRGLLAAATGSRWRGLLSGALITTLVQSSSAVIFATIGFVNAGLLSLGQAVGLVIGANVGTTMTSWIVAAVGFDLDLKAFAMPAIALGMGLWVSSRGRRAALGQAAAGFGVFFLALDILKQAFAGFGGDLDFGALPTTGVLGVGLFAVLGAVLTVLMQSSSATTAVTLTAAASGVLPLPAAAAMVIGANVGTTSTAVFATLGATAAARRTAAAHVIFNLLLALLVLPLLPWLLALVQALALRIGEPGPAVELALLHSAANLLTMLVMLPLVGALVRWLEGHLAAAEVDEAVPRHLDRTVLATPPLALEAVQRELARLGGLSLAMARHALNLEQAEPAALQPERALVERLSEAIVSFAAQVQTGGDSTIDRGLLDALRRAQYFRIVAERAVDLAEIAAPHPLPESIAAHAIELRGLAQAMFDLSAQPAPDPVAVTETLAGFQTLYGHCKNDLLRAGARAELAASALVRQLDRNNLLQRQVEAAAKAAGAAI